MVKSTIANSMTCMKGWVEPNFWAKVNSRVGIFLHSRDFSYRGIHTKNKTLSYSWKNFQITYAQRFEKPCVQPMCEWLYPRLQNLVCNPCTKFCCISIMNIRGEALLDFHHGVMRSRCNFIWINCVFGLQPLDLMSNWILSFQLC